MPPEIDSAPVSGTTPASAAPTGTTPSATEFGSFLGVEASDLPSLRPAQNPEPSGTEATGEEPAVAAGEEIGTEETLEAAPEGEEQLEAEASPEADDNWLPQEQAKEFPEATLKEYAERRGYKWDPQDESQMRLLRDKLNTDIYVEQLRQDLDNQGFEETTAAEAAEPSTEAAVSTTTDPKAQHYSQVDAVVSQIDKQATEELGRSLLGAMGVNADAQHLQQLQTALRNPQTTPAQRAEIQQHLDLVQNAGKIGSTLARGAVDVIMTTIPNLLPQILESVAPGMVSAYKGAVQVQEAGAAWERVGKATNQTGQPVYQNLPVYRSKEYFAAVAKTERELGLNVGSGIDKMQLFDDKGQPLSPQAQYEAKMRMIARVASGLNPQPAAPAIERAVNAGRQQERTQNQRRAVGRALGAGATSQRFEQEEPKDEVRDALKKAIAEQNSQGNPFAGAVSRGA
jgi:hypothetical protein